MLGLAAAVVVDADAAHFLDDFSLLKKSRRSWGTIETSLRKNSRE